MIALFAALLLALLLALRATRPRPVDQRRILEDLRRALLSSPSLRAAHRDVCAALETWRLLPSADGAARTEPRARAIHIVVLDALARPFDGNTLLRALAHEACHAAGHVGHDAAFFQKQDACLAALHRDGLIDLDAPPHFAYPAAILELEP